MLDRSSPAPSRGRIALAMGCPAGIAPELTARVLSDAETLAAAAITVFGDRRVLEAGARSADVTPRIAVRTTIDGPEPATARQRSSISANSIQRRSL